MAKKKNSKGNGQQPFSEKRYIQERLRTIPIGKCYANPAWKKAGETNVVVTRKHKQGTYTVGFYLVDTYCIGVKDSFYRFSMDEYEYEEMIGQLLERDRSMEEVSYNEAHNLIWGAVAFAEEAGIKPDKSFGLTQYILEEDTDDVPLIEYEFGKDGEHFLVANNRLELSKYLPTMRKVLGDDVKYMVKMDLDEDGDDEYYDDDDDDDDDDVSDPKPQWNTHLVEEDYHYDAPDYPKELQMHNPQILDVLSKDEYVYGLPDEELDKILALDKEELREDLENILLYSCNYERRGEDYEYNSVFHAMFLIAEVGNEHSLEVVLETLRQGDEYEDFFFCDDAIDAYIKTIAKLGADHLDLLGKFLHEPGLRAQSRTYVMGSLVRILLNNPDRREELLSWWRDLLDFYIKALPNVEGCDSTTAGLAIVYVINSGMDELRDEVKQLFATGLVEDEICGTEEEVMNDLDHEAVAGLNFDLDIYARYHEMKE